MEQKWNGRKAEWKRSSEWTRESTEAIKTPAEAEDEWTTTEAEEITGARDEWRSAREETGTSRIGQRSESIRLPFYGLWVHRRSLMRDRSDEDGTGECTPTHLQAEVPHRPVKLRT